MYYNHKFHFNSLLNKAIYIITFINAVTNVLASEKNHKVKYCLISH